VAPSRSCGILHIYFTCSSLCHIPNKFIRIEVSHNISSDLNLDCTESSSVLKGFINLMQWFWTAFLHYFCGLVVRVLGYRSRGTGFDSWHYQIFWEVVGLEWGPLSLVSTIEELLGRNSSRSIIDKLEYGCGDPLRWPRTNFADKWRSLGQYSSLTD
jgi:hypothetical protein